MKVLIAEDDPVAGAALREYLTMKGFEVSGPATSVRDLLAFARASPPDFAIIDIGLRGDMDGIEGAHLLRRRLDIPIVFFSAKDDADSQSRAAALKPVAFLCKPCPANYLLDVLGRAASQLDSPG
jgi:two-component system, response regulator PdtaR